MRNLAHLSENDLVAYLSHEVGPWRRSRIRGHADDCWICNCRLRETEDLLIDLAEEVRRWPAADAEAVRHAKAQFRKRILAEEPLETTKERPRRQTRRIAAACLAAAVVLVVACIFAARGTEDPLYRARNAEARQIKDASVRQEFELVVSSAGAQPSRSRIEVVNDRRTQRFAVTWRNPDGSLIYGLWRPSAARVLVYEAAEQSGVRPARSPLKNRTVNTVFPRAAGIQKAIGDWLEFREQRDIRLARDGFLTSKLGDLGKPAEVAKANGRVTVTWDEAAPYQSARLLLQLDAGTFLPISQTLQADSRALQVKIKLLSEAPVDPGSLSAQTFEPSQFLVMARVLPPRTFGLDLFAQAFRRQN